MDLSIEQILLRDGIIVLPVKGTSMLPMLNEKEDLIQLVTVSAPLRKGDLPLYKRPSGQYVLHRIIAVHRQFCVTCGDNCNVAEKVPMAWIIGVTEGFYKNGNYISCSNEEYLKYVRKMVRKKRVRSFLNRSRILRFLRRVLRFLRRITKRNKQYE